MDPVKREKQERVSKNVNGVHVYNFTRLFPFVNPAFGNLHLFKPTFFSFSLSFAFMENKAKEQLQKSSEMIVVFDN